MGTGRGPTEAEAVLRESAESRDGRGPGGGGPGGAAAGRGSEVDPGEGAGRRRILKEERRGGA